MEVAMGIVFVLIFVFVFIFFVFNIIKSIWVHSKVTKVTKVVFEKFKDISQMNDFSIFNDFDLEDHAVKTNDDDDELLKRIGFNRQEILDYAFNVFKLVAKAWGEFDYSTLRRHYSDFLYNRYFARLENIKYNGYKHVFDDIKLENISLYNVGLNKKGINVIVDLNVDMLDYIVDNKGNVVKGSDTNRCICSYRLIFTTHSKRENNLEVEKNCPNCGAVLKASHGKCAYCNTPIDMNKHDLVISNKIRLTETWIRNY